MSYPTPTASPLEVLSAEIRWLEAQLKDAQRARRNAERTVACIETRMHDLRMHYERLYRTEKPDA